MSCNCTEDNNVANAIFYLLIPTAKPIASELTLDVRKLFGVAKDKLHRELFILLIKNYAKENECTVTVDKSRFKVTIKW
jgi:hypothetical protein